MAETAAASLNILHDGQFYRSDKQTAELLRQVQHWQAGGDRALETALFDHGLKTGRLQPGRAAREQAETAHRQPLTLEAPEHVDQDMSHLQEHFDDLVEFAREQKEWDLREPSPESISRGEALEAVAWEREAHDFPETFDTPDQRAAREAARQTDKHGRAQVTSLESLRQRTASWASEIVADVKSAWHRAGQLIERWLRSPADTHSQRGAAFRDQTAMRTRMAHVTDASQTRTLDATGWLPAQVVTIREETANGLLRQRELTPRELRSATMLQSSSAGQATGVPERRENEARNQPVRQAVDPPLRQPGSAWNTTVKQAWSGTTVRHRAAAEQRPIVAWQVNQPRPLAFRATRARGVEQGQG